MIALNHWLAISLWVVLGVPAALLVTFVGGRLLGARRGWAALLLSGILGWTIGVLIAGGVTSWSWDSRRMMLLALIVYVYLNWPGVRQAFMKSEMDRLTPEQRAAIEQLEAANAQAGTKTPGM